MKKYIYLLLALMILFVSCNADIFTNSIEKLETKPSTSNTTAVFTGEAPRNVWASQSYYTDRVIVSFDGVGGADYYNIHRAIVPRTQSNIDFDDLVWERIPYQIQSTSGNIRYTYEDTDIDNDNKNSVMYCYSITAGSYFVDSRGGLESQYSNVVEGWTLSPPISLSATQGEDDEYIELRWSQVGMVSGYDLYYSLDSNAASEAWIKANSTKIPGTLNSEISYRFDPVRDYNNKSLLGKNIYFRVVSYSRANKPSERSGLRVGYTFVEGAPTKPTGVLVSSGDYPDRISITWDKTLRETQVAGGYTWIITRATATTDAKEILSFATDDLSNPKKIPAGLSLNDGKYTFIDSSSELNPAEEYIYSISAKCSIENPEDPSSTIMVPGQAVEKTGYLLAPSTNIADKKTQFPTSSFSGAFEFTIAEPPKGYSDSKHFDYVIYGRNNVDGVIGAWKELTTIAVTSNPSNVVINYDPENPVNEFSYAIRNNDIDIASYPNNISTRYDAITGYAIITPLAPAPSVDKLNLKNNTYRSDLTPNANGVYPVIVNCIADDVYSNYKIEVIETSSPNNNSTVAGEIFVGAGSDVILSTKFSPSNVGEKWSYRMAGKDAFGRYSEYGAYKLGYGAITNAVFIKFFEAYGLKPWEFCNYPDYPQDLKNKWNSSEIAATIRAESTSANIVEYSNYHSGSIRYTVKINGFKGDVRFTYTNFGEHPDFKITSGMYQMTVGLSGTGTISANTPFIIEGMYPATVLITPDNMKVTAKAFDGSYSVSQSNGSATELVKATKN